MDLDVALRAVRNGTWQELLPGAWLRGGSDITRGHRQLAALELLGPEALLTGPDACDEYGMRDVPRDERVFVLVPHRVQRRLGPHVCIRRTRALPTSYRMRGRRWAAPARAVIDAAYDQDLRAARAVVSAAVADGWLGVDDLRVAIGAAPRRGSAVLRRVLGDVAAGARWAPEAEAADVLTAAVRAGRLPPFLLNPDLLVRGKPVLTPDLWLLGTGVGGELDSRRHHGSQDTLDATLARHARAERLGIALVHRSPSRFRADPEAFVDELAARVAECPEPPELVVVPHGPVLPLRRN